MSHSIAAYPFPDDDGETLTRLVSRLPNQARFEMTWCPTEDWLLTVTLRLPKPRSYQTIIPDRRRRIVQELLLWLPGGVVGWERVETVEFETVAARLAFEALI